MKPEELKELLLKIITLQQQIAGQQHELFALLQRVKINETIADYVGKFQESRHVVVERPDSVSQVQLKNAIQRKLGNPPAWQRKLKESLEEERQQAEERKRRAAEQRAKELAGKCHKCTISISGEYSYNQSTKYPNLCSSCEARKDEVIGIAKEEVETHKAEGYYYKVPGQI